MKHAYKSLNGVDRDERADELKTALVERDRRIAELTARVDVLTTLVAAHLPAKSGVIDLPIGGIAMWRKPLVRVDTVGAWEMARSQFAALMHERDQLRQDLADTKRQRDEVLAALRDLQAAVRATLGSRDGGAAVEGAARGQARSSCSQHAAALKTWS
jgi:hypothetical protein